MRDRWCVLLLRADERNSPYLALCVQLGHRQRFIITTLQWCDCALAVELSLKD